MSLTLTAGYPRISDTDSRRIRSLPKSMIADLFGQMPAAAPVKRSRKLGCARDPDAGPGSCWHWYESCPKSIPDCYTREIFEIARRHGIGRGDPIPDAMRTEIAAMDVRRRADRR